MLRLNFMASLVASLLCGLAVAAPPDGHYRLTSIDAPGGSVTDPAGLNDRGEVVGSVQGPNGPRAFLWRDGTFTDLAPLIAPDSPFTSAVAINNRSQVVGDFIDEQSTFRSYRLSRGTVTVLAFVPGESATFVHDINDRGQIIADTVDAQFSTRSVLLDRHGAITFLDPFPGAVSASVNDVNDRGVVVGSNNTQAEQRAVLWENGAITDLGIPQSSARSINNRGEIVGFKQAGSGTGLRAFLWDDGNFIELPLLEPLAQSTTAFAINNGGAAVGTTVLGNSSSVATLWEQGAVFNLNDLILATDPLARRVKLESGALINDRGQVVARGRDSRSANVIRAYLLTPTH
ncbi:MAG TPA: hypothetical protein VJQ52_21985 [Steroidobacteraceae bacterium]|nr:hypothetical protein [Steroidobacteraceae bacterium]